jgi:dihydrofolate reductase
MRPLRYSINITLDGCCDHRAGSPDEELFRNVVEYFELADALILGRVTYEMMETAWRRPAPPGTRPDWMEPFVRAINAKKKYVMSSTLARVDWNAELIHGDLEKAVQQLKRQAGKGLLVGGVKLPLALAELGLIDEYQFVASQASGPWADIIRRAIEACGFKARQPAGVRLRGGGDAV